MSKECNTTGTFALLLSLDVKFVNTFQRNTAYFNASCKTYSYLSKRFTIDHRDIINGEFYNRCNLNIDVSTFKIDHA